MIIGLHFAADNMSIFVEIFMTGIVTIFCFRRSDVSAVQGHPRSFMLVPIESTYMWLHISPYNNSNLGPYLAPFRGYDSFYVLLSPPLFHPNFGGFPLTRSPMLGSASAYAFRHEIIFEEFQPIWPRYLIVTDGRTDGGTTCNLRLTALCASIAQ